LLKDQSTKFPNGNIPGKNSDDWCQFPERDIFDQRKIYTSEKNAKHQNISAVLRLLGQPVISGHLPV
jgi:hypothetical protein